MEWTRGHAVGRGSTATVYVATSRQSGEVSAVKSVEISKSKFLQREKEILSSLDSPYIVRYRGFDITNEKNRVIYNLFMEYVPGGTLTDAVRKQGGEVEEPMIGFYTRQILQGLDYLHSNGIVHCDIKRENVLIGERGAKIADFGCAKRMGSDQIGGTPLFMAPEVARGEEQGMPADIWALGCTVIEMATGRSPWPELSDPVSALYHIGFSGQSPTIPCFLSEEAKDFLSNCLRREPTERWTAKQLLKHAFLNPEFNSGGKGIKESESPTSILDQGLWASLVESDNPGDLMNQSCSNSPGERIGRLTTISEGPNWNWDESWISVRSNDVDMDRGEAETHTTCGFLIEPGVRNISGVDCKYVDGDIILRDFSYPPKKRRRIAEETWSVNSSSDLLVQTQFS